MEKYSVLVMRVVSVRIDNIEAESREAAIKAAETADFSQLIIKQDAPYIHFDHKNQDGTMPCVRYVEDGDESAEFLVDEAGDEEFTHSEWYKADGVTRITMEQRITNN